MADAGIALHTSKDHVVFERSELLTGSGKPYTVFTPYKVAWMKKVEPFYLKAYPVEKYADALAPVPEGVRHGIPTLAEIGFEKTNLHEIELGRGTDGALKLLDDFLPRMQAYDETRDFPAVRGSLESRSAARSNAGN